MKSAVEIISSHIVIGIINKIAIKFLYFQKILMRALCCRSFRSKLTDQGCIFSIIREYLLGYSLLDFFGWGRVCLESLDFS